ncbi:N-acetylglucosamine-6-phosphate deacetylase [Rubellimicrobium aerolatum]|uniref:N-acetylglucosamine-6-phosphate deacetylase n=1 Tax=Rubellimicrobium aerolatum TaxID=490979 RepID=A0ABW0SG04_9RHOB|nr:N-acetylglucosamine-6-phosphate deacetylase [Rubellimicrobium aerolatum]MBP1805819.1 N-acetylglucosamine-6-phosphate deacetylase [Rubellimicrobium aerolatum]
MTWLAPARLFDGERLRESLALRFEEGRVADLAPLDARMNAHPLPGTVTPGYVDLQVNGGGGVLLNADPTVAGMEAIAAAHRRLGTVALLPTVITDAPEVLDRAAEAALAAKGKPGLLGLHIEGPHIAPARRGTHAARFIRPLDDRTLTLVRRLREGGVPVLLTLAPEATTPGQIAALAAMGTVVSLGHSDATAAQARAALAEGARAVTHLFNAMSPLTHREPGLVGAALNSTVPAGIIADGHHVAFEVLALALRARLAPDLLFLVSDAMPTVGGPDRFRLYDMDLHVQDGRLLNPEGNLAGAHTTMAEGVANLVAQAGVPPEAALRMAVTIPARLIGRPGLATLEGRPAADLLRLDAALRPLGPPGETLVDLGPPIQ